MPRKSLDPAIASAMSKARVTFGAGTGRPRKRTARCQCGVMTLKRAKARGKTKEHRAGCEYSPARKRKTAAGAPTTS